MVHTFIIAEAGVNHNGDLSMAMQMVEIAAKAGADAVKFQTFSAEALTTKDADKADYQKLNTDAEESQQAMLASLELSPDEYKQIYQHCQQYGIEFMSTAFDEQSLDFLIELGIQRIKIPSGELTNLPLLRHAASKELPVIVSTGMATLQEIEDTLGVLYQAGVNQSELIVLHCNTAYPTPFEDVNLSCLQTMHNHFKLPIGYSDHTQGDEVAIASVALGAVAIEKHFTIDRGLPGPDQSTSLEPEEFAAMVQRIRNIEQVKGDGIKQPTASEKINIEIARKSIVAKTDIKQGDFFSSENITTKRPATGLSPMKWDEVVGQTAKRDFKADELIEL